MQGLILSTILILAVLPAYLEAGRMEKKQCSKWTFGECVPTTGNCGRGKKTGTRTGEHCSPTTKDFKCKVPCAGENVERCKYEKPDASQWSECDAATKKMSAEATLKAGSSSTCAATKTMFKRCKAKKRPADACKYVHKGAKWSTCDPTTGKQNVTLSLSAKSDPEKCPAVKELSRKCKRRARCKYDKGEWTACDAATGQKTRVDTLKGDPRDGCDATKTKTKNCRNSRCRYQFSDWSEQCTDGQRSRTKTLIKGDGAICENHIVQTRTCTKENGKDKCFFGAWGEFGSCQNGVRTKTRRVVSGGASCHKKAVKTRMCKDRQGEARKRKAEEKHRKRENRRRRREEKIKEKQERRNRRKIKKNRGGL